VQQFKNKILFLACLCAFVPALSADQVKPKTNQELVKPPPYQIPLFDGDASRTKEQPKEPLVMPVLPNARELFDLVVSCWPEKSWFRGELSMEARSTRQTSDATSTYNSSTSTFDPVSGQIQTTSGNYVGIVGRIPLWSATELDKEREREVGRRGQIAAAVGTYITALAEHKLNERELQLQQALEKRTQERVALGISETREQVSYLEKVAQLEGKGLKTSADLIKSRVQISGMCDDHKAWVIDEYLKRFSEVR
jgi:hypothetical protein